MTTLGLPQERKVGLTLGVSQRKSPTQEKNYILISVQKNDLIEFFILKTTRR